MMKLLKKIKEINEYFDKLHDNVPYIGDIAPKTWKQLKKILIIIGFIILGLAIFTLILSFIL